MATSQKVVLSKVPDEQAGKAGQYRVVKLVNRMAPEIGTQVGEKEVKRLIGDAKIRVEIVPSRERG